MTSPSTRERLFGRREQFIVGFDGGRYERASAPRRWFSRLIDAVIVVGVAVAAAVVGKNTGTSETATIAFFGAYTCAALVLGVLYGLGYGIGQMAMGMKSRLARNGRRVGPFRGAWRYLLIAYFPVTIFVVVSAFFTNAPYVGEGHESIVPARRRSS